MANSVGFEGYVIIKGFYFAPVPVWNKIIFLVAPLLNCYTRKWLLFNPPSTRPLSTTSDAVVKTN